MKLEFLALKWVRTKKFREYLLGQKCIVFTDNNTLFHLSTAKLGATEQRWVAQLAAFDYEIRYQSGKSNQNADALSRQYLTADTGPVELLKMAFPLTLQQAGLNQVPLEVAQSSITVLSDYSLSELKRRCLSVAEWRQLTPNALVLLGQWDHLVDKDGLLHHQMSHHDGAEEVLQLVLPAPLKPVAMGQHHQNHRHQGVVRTSRLVQQRCYWPGMFIDIKHWCQECEHCQVSKGEQPVPHSFMGHLLDSRPNEPLAGHFTVLEPAHIGIEKLTNGST